jgi:hypothetical protein
MNTTVYSVYIPNMHNKWSRTAISDFFCRENYGIVNRIDFTDILLQDGSKKPNFKSAFIFFTTNNVENPLTKELGSRGFRIHPTMRVADYRGFDRYVNHTSANGQPEYWIALPNKSVVPDCNETLPFIANRFAACYELFRLIPETEESKKEFDTYIHDCNCLAAYENATPEQFEFLPTNKHQICHNSKLLFERLVPLALAALNLAERDLLRGIHPAIDEFI